MSAYAKEPADFVDFSDLDDGLVGGSAPLMSPDEIRKSTSIANGGDVAQATCPKCGGSGRWRGIKSCFTCQGKGKVSNRSAGAFKAMATKEANRRKQAAMPNRGAVDISKIEALFDKARASGLKRLAFRTEHIKIKAAKDTGRNPGALYVEHDGEYAGKIVGGVFKPFNAKPNTHALVCEIAEDPAGRAKQYGIQTGICSCCGAELTDPLSIANGIGPICADNWGL